MRALILVGIMVSAHASATLAQQLVELPIWPGKAAPGSEEWTHHEIDDLSSSSEFKMVRDVVNPTITVYKPLSTQPNGTGVIVVPGGAFHFLSWEIEGTAVADWLATRGVTAFVLKYRLIKTPADPSEFEKYFDDFNARVQEAAQVSPGNAGRAMLQSDEMRSIRAMALSDAQQAVKYVRAHATEWHIDAHRIGMIGFSAGAYVATGVLMDHDAASRLDFAAAIYGGETGGRPVPSDSPPLFLAVTQDDSLVYEAVGQLYRDWNGAQHPVELHSFSKGGHGFGMLKQHLPVDHWIELYGNWLDSLGLLKLGDRPPNAQGVSEPSSGRK